MNNRETQGGSTDIAIRKPRVRSAGANARQTSSTGVATAARWQGGFSCRGGSGIGFTHTTPSSSDGTTKAPGSPRPLMLVCKSRLRVQRGGDLAEHQV